MESNTRRDIDKLRRTTDSLSNQLGNVPARPAEPFAGPFWGVAELTEDLPHGAVGAWESAECKVYYQDNELEAWIDLPASTTRVYNDGIGLEGLENPIPNGTVFRYRMRKHRMFFDTANLDCAE